MRSLKAKDIFLKTYSVVDGEIIKNDKGDYYTKQAAEYARDNQSSTNKNDMKKIVKFDEEKLNTNSIKYFRDQYNDILSSEANIVNLLYKPIKKFEIFKLDVCGGKICLARASSLPDGNNRELYYNFAIANQIYQKNIDIQDSTFNDYDDVKYIYEREILKIEDEISDLKVRDEEEFKEDSIAYNLISQTSLYDDYQLLSRDNERLIQKNKKLNKTILDYNEKIRDLSEKLKVSLERVEFLQRPKTFKEKLKELFGNERKQLLMANMKGEK